MAVDKVWVIVYRVRLTRVEFLVLAPNVESGLNYDYYVVTGDIEHGETAAEAAEREVYEEIGVKPVKCIGLGKSIDYTDKLSGERHIEACYGAQITNFDLVLNEEHVGYEWMNPEKFKSSIWWEDEPIKLEAILDKLTKAISINF